MSYAAILFCQKVGLILLLLSLCIAGFKPLLAANSLDVVTNEVAWMGTEASTRDEWIELYNTTDQDIDLTDWALVSDDGSPNFTFTSQDCGNLGIPAQGFFLLERTNNTTVSDIEADCIYTGNLSNSGETLTLEDTSGNVIDTANGDGGAWSAGTASAGSPPYATMERIDPLALDSDDNWCTNDGVHRNGSDADGNPINGTPKARNSCTNQPPIADAGPDQNVNVGDTADLDGSGSSDPDSDSLSYSWSFVSKPAGSAAALSDPNIINPTFVADVAGDYILELTVDDGRGGTDSDQVKVTANPLPVGGIGDPPIYKNLIAFATPEFAWKGPYRDFNDDLEVEDCVLRYLNLDTGQVVNTGQMVSFAPKNIEIYENIIVFVDEDNRVRYYDIDTGKVGETGASGSHPSIYGDMVAFNSRGKIYHFHLGTGRLSDTGISGNFPVIYDHIIAFSSGSPATIRYYDLRTETVEDTGAVGTEPTFWGEVISFTTEEGSISADLNDDGDLKDQVIRYYHLGEGLVDSTGAIGSYPAIHGKRIAFMTAERSTGGDLNNDGDLKDTLVRYYDLEAGRVFNTGKLGVEPDIYEDVISFWYFEPWEHRDLNGDGDRSDPLVQPYRINSVGTAEPLVVETVLAYPNPVRSSATVRFVAEGQGVSSIKVQIYDLAGRAIYDSGFVAGNSLEWPLMNDRGSIVANGVYLYIVTVRGFSEDELLRSGVKKLVILR